jgi:hypothetical protein
MIEPSWRRSFKKFWIASMFGTLISGLRII